MTLTRAHVEYSLISRCKKRMAFVGMTITSDGDNPDLNEPIATALMQMGITPSDPTNIRDSDLSSITDMLELFDLAELCLLENIYGNMDMVDITEGPRTERLSQFTADLEKAIQRKQANIASEYGAVGTLQAGVIDLDFQEKAEE